MRKLNVTEPTAEWWTEWRHKCEDATEVLIREVRDGNAIEIDNELYKKHKYKFLMNLDGPFRNKCAYCERDLDSQHGDVEHFRPKKNAKDEDDRTISRVAGRVDQEHPGYYWLAYDWTNLLPSCQICNVGNREMSSGDKPGKRNRFPLEDETKRAWEPDMEGEERPLLLNPAVDDPAEHLIFDSSGMIGWRSKRGKTTIKILGLNDYNMPKGREGKYKEIKKRYTTLVLKHLGGNQDPDEEKEIDRVKDGYGNFTTSALLAIDDALKEIKNKLEIEYTQFRG